MVDAKVDLPGLGVEWALANLVQLRRKLGPLWPGCREDLTAEIAFGMQISVENFDLDMAARVEDQRIAANEAMADVFDQADVLIAATNPDVAFGAEVTLNTSVDGRTVRPENNGALTIPANVTGNPAVSIPIGAIDGMPVGMQVIGPHHHDAVLLDLARIVERARPWPLVAPGSPV